MPLKTSYTDSWDMPAFERVQLVAMCFLTGLWFFMLGASFGSFLNVLVYRLPIGKSLWRSGSACPKCGHHILITDNVPVLGWLRLKGRCRNCQLPISPRYPLVEFAVGAVFVAYLFVMVISGGATLPVRPISTSPGIVSLVWSASEPELIELYAYHLVLFYLVLAIALMGLDGQTVPNSLVAFGLCVGLVWVLASPHLHPILTTQGATVGTAVLCRQAFCSAAIGWFWGGLAGVVVTAAVAMDGNVGLKCRAFVSGVISTAALVGLYLGPETVVSFSIILALLWVVVALAGWSSSVRVAGIWLALPTAVLVQLVGWRVLSIASYWPLHRQAWWLNATFLIEAGVISGGVLWLLRSDLAHAPSVDANPSDQASAGVHSDDLVAVSEVTGVV